MVKFLTSTLCDVVHYMLLSCLLQSFEEFVTLVLCRQKVQQSVSSSVDRSLTANISQLRASQHLQAQQLIQQTKVRLYEVGQFRLQSLDDRPRVTSFNWTYHITCFTLTSGSASTDRPRNTMNITFIRRVDHFKSKDVTLSACLSLGLKYLISPHHRWAKICLRD